MEIGRKKRLRMDHEGIATIEMHIFRNADFDDPQDRDFYSVNMLKDKTSRMTINGPLFDPDDKEAKRKAIDALQLCIGQVIRHGVFPDDSPIYETKKTEGGWVTVCKGYPEQIPK